MQHLQVSNGYFQLWHSYLQGIGQDWRDWPCWRAEQVAQLNVLLQQPVDSQTEFQLFWDVMAHTQQRLKRPNWVLDMAKTVTPAHFGLLGYMASRSASVAEGLDYVQRFSRLVFDGEQVVPIQLQAQGGQIRLFWRLLTPELVLLNELTIAAMVHLFKQLIPSQALLLQQVEMAHSPQMALKYYQQFYPCTVRFAQAQYAIVLSADSLAVRPQDADPTLMQILLKQAEEALAQRDVKHNIVLQLQWVMQAYLLQRQQAPKIEAIAAEMLMSVRTLQRHLKQHHSSFKQLLEQVRCNRCQQLLAQDCPFTEIAEQLGYSDQSALARAYKQQTGQTLRQYKRALLLKNASSNLNATSHAAATHATITSDTTAI